MLVYSTYSPTPAETRDVVRNFLTTRGRAKLLDVGEVADRVTVHDISTRGSMIRLWVDVDCTDGMFITFITKEAADVEAVTDSMTN